MKVYTIVVTILLFFMVITSVCLGSFAYYNLQTQISMNLDTEQHNSKTLQAEMTQAFKNQKILNKSQKTLQKEMLLIYKLIFSSVTPEEKPSKYSSPKDSTKLVPENGN